jgi:hypothetical protein
VATEAIFTLAERFVIPAGVSRSRTTGTPAPAGTR